MHRAMAAAFDLPRLMRFSFIPNWPVPRIP
jgi:hypothetical protein